MNLARHFLYFFQEKIGHFNDTTTQDRGIAIFFLCLLHSGRSIIAGNAYIASLFETTKKLPLCKVLCKIGDNHIRPSPSNTQQGFRHRFIEIEPTVFAGGNQHRTFATYMIGCNRELKFSFIM